MYIIQPICLGYVTNYFLQDMDSLSFTQAYLFGLGLVLTSACISIVHAHGYQYGYECGMDIRTIVTSAIYQKVCSLKQW